MPDANTVAAISVASSAAVAVLATGAQVVLRSGDRRHERRLAIEARAWPDRSAMLLQATTYGIHLQRLVSDFEGQANAHTVLPRLREARGELDGRLAAALTLYGSHETRARLRQLQFMLRSLDLDDADAWDRLRLARGQKTARIDAQDFEGAASARQDEKREAEGLGLPTGDPSLGVVIDKLLSSLRDDVWTPVRTGLPRRTQASRWITHRRLRAQLRRARKRANKAATPS